MARELLCIHAISLFSTAFIFSAAGISRSVTITVMYLMTISKLSFDECLTVVQHCREMANPNAGFRAQLVQYQQDKLLEV